MSSVLLDCPVLMMRFKTSQGIKDERNHVFGVFGTFATSPRTWAAEQMAVSPGRGGMNKKWRASRRPHYHFERRRIATTRCPPS